jgi:hypothetical protein
MPNVMKDPTNFPRRINSYVPAMQYSSDVNYNGMTRVNFGASPTATTNSIVNAQSTSVAGSMDLSNVAPVQETYGRTLVYVGSGAGAPVLTMNGWDYLGQPIQEVITINGATPVLGKKAFKAFNNMSWTAVAITVSVGIGASLGLPYHALAVAYEVANGALAAAGTLIAAVLTDPQTGLTGDPRGCYTPVTALNGSNVISAAFEFCNDINSAGNGGLHGIRHFGG